MKHRRARGVGLWLLCCSAACSNGDKQTDPGLGSAGVGGAASGQDASGGDAGTPPPRAMAGRGGAPPVSSGGGFSGPGGLGAPDASVGLVLDASIAPLDAGIRAPSDAGADASPSYGDDAGPSLDPALAERLRSISARLEPLAARTFAFWFEHGPDSVFGGFHGTLSRRGDPIAPEDKGLIQETRHLWMLSTWYERRERSAVIAALAASTYDFIAQSFVDTDGAFVFKVSRDGSRVVDAKKQLFAESYAIYALSTYGRVFGAPEAIELALARFESIDASRHDATFGGYDQRGDPGFLSAGAEKDTNTHLHLMEAFTALYEATADARVAARLSELVNIFASRLLQPSGYVHAEFTRDFRPFGTPRVSYGHDLETAWLLLEAARVIGRAADPALRAAALEMAEHSAERGADLARGGYFEAGVPGGTTNDFDKVWWVQFEALAGLWSAYDVSGDPSHLTQLEATLGWIELSEDLPAGEWFATTNPDGTAAGSDYKGDEWKASYHTVRALVFVQDWIEEELSRGR